MLRDPGGQPFDEVAMRIDERTTSPERDVLRNQRLEKRSLTRTGLADDVHVRQPICLLDAEGTERSAVIAVCEV